MSALRGAMCTRFSVCGGGRVTEKSGERKAEKGENRNGQTGQNYLKAGKTENGGNGEAGEQRINKRSRQAENAGSQKQGDEKKKETATAT